ncbi:MAG: beta-glucosidase [Acidobacteriota bacterium]
MNLYPRAPRRVSIILGLSALVALSPQCARHSPNGNVGDVPKYPWLNRALSPDVRAGLVLEQMTLNEKIFLLHGTAWHALDFSTMNLGLLQSNGGVGYVVGIPRLRIPGIQMTNASYGVTRSRRNHRYSTALPDDLALAATWDADAAYEYGALLGRELRAQGYNMSLGGGVNLAREPRDGRTFEFLGEDPILAGTIAGQEVAGTQAQHVIGDIKHFAMNDRETDRHKLNINIDKRAMRETDLLAFEIGLRISHAGAVMCAYNGVNGEPSCQNKYLLTDVLRKDWKFPGFVLSDWGATHSTVKAFAAGLDQEEPSSVFYGEAMKRAMLAGKVSMAELDEHVHRILRSEFASGIVDDPPREGPIDVDRDLNVAQHLAEESMVLLRNENAQLPLDAAKLRTIAVIGAHADVAMISGGGSGHVDAPAGSAPHFDWRGLRRSAAWFPTSPLKALCARAPHARIEYDSGANPAAAAALARAADVAIVFAYQWESEGMDLATLSLPGNQNALVEQVAHANPHTIVVLETGSPALMPWANNVSAILEAWYAGSRGADAVANVLFGYVNPSAKLPITFPLRDADMPQPTVVEPPAAQRENSAFANLAALFGPPSKQPPPVQLYYNDGLLVGYKWYAAKQKSVLFPFGFGLSYTQFRYSGLRVKDDGGVSVNFTIQNTGNRAGAEVAEVYASLPPSAGEPPMRLIGWQRTQLNPGESKRVSLNIQPQYLSVLDVGQDEWRLVPGEYTIFVGGSSENLPLRQQVRLGQ